jgi:glycerol-3-phosphate dehydrogenase (NAD(P)+)
MTDAVQHPTTKPLPIVGGSHPITQPISTPLVLKPGQSRVAVLGAGSWGTTFAKVLADGGSSVAIWARRAELAREIMQSRRNSDYLPGINLPRGIQSSTRLPEVLEGAQQVYLSVPSQSLRENLRIVRDLIPDGIPIVSLM